MQALLRGLGSIALVLAGCAEEERPSELVELPHGPCEDLTARRQRGEWVLESPNEELRFLVGDLERERWSPHAESVLLADGGVLASFCVEISEGFDYRLCYLQLARTGDGWRPVSVGLHVMSDVGFYWLEGIQGRVIVDSGAPDILCRVELRATQGPAWTLRRDFLVDPARNSSGLRETLLRWQGGGPALR